MSGHTRVSAFNSWIDSIINPGSGGGGSGGGGGNNGHHGKPFTLATSAVPEPSSLGLLAIGALGLLRRRRQQA